jgi:hypothetical protein
MIYILWRKESLNVFSWLRAVGLGPLVLALRESLQDLGARLPDAVRYSFPDAAWIYAATSYQGFIWRGGSVRGFWSWMLIAPLLGIGGELGQALGIVPGTFCQSDFALGIAASVAAIWILLKFRSKSLEIES